MKKVIFGLFLMMVVITALFVTNVFATEAVTFFDAGTNEEIAGLGKSDNVYANVSFDSAESGSAVVIVARFDGEGNLISPVDIDKSVSVNNGIYKTSSVAVTDDTKLIKVFAWDSLNSMYPVLKTPGELTVKHDEFAVKFENTDKYLYRIGNKNTVALGSLFKALDGANIGSVAVDVKTLDTSSNVKLSNYSSSNSDWTKRTLQFEGTGVVSITVYDEDSFPVTLCVEVVDANNATAATNVTNGDVVLLNNCGFGTFEVSNGYTLYGNGFTLSRTSDSAVKDMSYSFVTLNNGTLDNVKIVCPNFSHAVLYKSNMSEDNNPGDGEGRYYNTMNGVSMNGISKIINSYISGGRVAISAASGDPLVENTTVYGGAAANIQLGTINNITLRDVTLIQEPIKANVNDTTKTLMGLSVVAIADASGNTPSVTLEGEFVQYAWANAEYKSYVPSAGQSLVSTALGKTDYIHKITYSDGVTRDSINLGFTYIPESLTVNTPTINDNRANKSAVPYETVSVSLAKIYSYKNTSGTDAEFATIPQYASTKHEDILASVAYSDVNENRIFTKEYDIANGWINKLTVDLDQGAYTFDFNKLKVQKYGKDLEYTVYDSNGNVVDKTKNVNLAAGTTEYNLTVTDNVFCDNSGQLVNGKEKTYTLKFNVIATETSKKAPKVVAKNFEAGLCVASSKGGTWHGAAPVLEGIQIEYWSTDASAYKTITLSDYTPTTPGQQNSTNNTWTYNGSDFTLTVTNTAYVQSGNKVYAMPVVCDNKLYFVPSNTKGLVNSGNSARTIAISYEFTDDLGKSLETTLSNTWSIAENQNEEYNYSDFCKGTKTLLTSSSSSCITPETLITLADGTKKEVQYLTGEEELLVWNMETGKYDKAPIVFVDSDEETTYEVIDLYFSDGSKVGVIYEHGFFDTDLAKYVYITADNARDYIGHKFVKQADIQNNIWNIVTLEKVVIENKVTKAYSPVTFKHLCYYTEGVLSMPGGVNGIFNIFDVDSSAMSYDAEKKKADIAKYGLFTYADFEGVVSETAFEAFNGEYLKVAIGKGLLTWKDIEYMAQRYMPLVSENK